MHSIHESVLLHEVQHALPLREGDTLLDGTVNGGGHAAAFLERYPGIRLIGIDLDPEAIRRARARLGEGATLVQGNFRELDLVLEKLGVSELSGALFDLGLSSDQLASTGAEGRGFSFLSDEPLSMAMNPEAEFTARDIVNGWAEEDIANVLFGYGEERLSRKIARAIVAARAIAPIETSGDLARIVSEAVPRRGRTHPATKTFQALRIAVNDELKNVREGLPKAFRLLKQGGRLAVISFHSLEDRIVKNLFREWADSGAGTLVTKRPIKPSDEEVTQNPRSRSALLRVIERL